MSTGRLVRPLVTLHPKRLHRLGSERQRGERLLFGAAAQPLLGFDLALGSRFGCIAVPDMLGHGEAEARPVEVVGVLADELVDRAEMALDPVQEAGVGGRGDELDVAGVRPGADRRRPVAGEVVLDPVDASAPSA